MPNAHGYPEADWTTFRELTQVALQRFCQQTLDDVRSVASDRSASPHETYLRMYRIMRERDDELSRLFDDIRRSNMMARLLAIYDKGLLEPAEFARFSESTRKSIQSLHRALKGTAATTGD